MALLERYDGILARTLTALRRHHGPRLVACAVVGPVGRGTPREDSDVDLLVVARDLPAGRLRRMAGVAENEAEVAPFLWPAGAARIELSPIFRVTSRSLAEAYLAKAQDAAGACAGAAWVLALAREAIRPLGDAASP